MKLVLSVISQTGTAVENLTLDGQSATIGRSGDNNLILDDPKRYISSHHAAIDYRAPDYFLTDTSTNGVIVNNASHPLGKGNSVRLNDGDRLQIGDYTLTITFSQPVGDEPEIPTGPLRDEAFPLDDDPFADFDKDSVQDMIEKNRLIPDDWKGDEADSFFDLPSSDELAGQKDNVQAAELDQPPAFKEAFEPYRGESEKKAAEPADIFAEDWYLDKKEEKNESDKVKKEDPFGDDFFAGLEKPASAPGDQVEKEPEQIIPPAADDKPVSDAEAVTPEADETQFSEKVTEPASPGESKQRERDIPTPPKPAVLEQDVAGDAVYDQVVEHFLRGVGLEGGTLHQAIKPETFYIVGKIMRASVQGTLDVLIGRAKIKNEMHLDVTMIRSRQNNPIKFSVSAEEAIKKLLAPEDSGYLSAEDAIEEAFDDIKAHQYSVIAGMQTALLEVLKRFDPEKLEDRLQQESPISASIPIHKQAKLWRLFERLYNDIEHEASDNFYHLFGEAFAETYQRQIDQLKNAKKETPF